MCMVFWHHSLAHLHHHFHDHSGMLKGQFRGTYFLLWWGRFLQELEPVWKESWTLNNNSQIPTRTKNINFTGLWAEPACWCPSIQLLQLSCLSWWWRNNAPQVVPVSSISNITHWTVGPLCWAMTKEWRSITLLMPASDEGSGSVLRTGRKTESRMDPLMHTAALGREDTHTGPTVLGGTGQLKVRRAQADYLRLCGLESSMHRAHN